MSSLLRQRLEAFDVDMPPCQPCFDRVFVWPVSDRGHGKDGEKEEKYKGTNLIMPPMAKGFYGASRGLLIAAGMLALDQLYSHGIELGHIVWYQRLSPWARQYQGNGRIQQVVLLRAMELVGSEDIMANFAANGLEIGVDTDGIHYIVDSDGKPVGKRFDPPLNVEDL